MFDFSVLLIGDTSRAEFRHARSSLEELGRVTQADDVQSAAAELTAGRITPDLIVLALAFPGQFPAKAIEQLRCLAPLARILALLGSWCEGEMRTGKPLPGLIRVYWHQWLARCSRESSRLHAGLLSGWGLPVTATDEERLLASENYCSESREGLVAICTRQHEMHDWLSAACRRRGHSTVWLTPDEPVHLAGATAAIFDGTDCDGVEVDQLERLVARIKPAPVVALCDFPRIEDHDRTIAAGAAAVLSKPLLLDDLFWQLDHVLQPVQLVARPEERRAW